MRVIRGRVLEIKNKHLILLTGDGQYVRIARPKRPVHLGEEMEASLPARQSGRKIAYAAVFSIAAVLMLAILPGLTGLPGSTADSYLALDINPSIEIAFDSELKVTGGKAFNPEGEELITGLVPGTELFEAVGHILERAASLSYLDLEKTDNVVMMSLASKTEKDELLEKLESLAREKLSSLEIEGYLAVSRSTVREHDKAVKKGISLNRHLLEEMLPPGLSISKEKVPVPIQSILKQLPPTTQIRTRPIPQNINPGKTGPPAFAPGMQDKPGEEDNDKPQTPPLPQLPGRPQDTEQFTPPAGPEQNNGEQPGARLKPDIVPPIETKEGSES